MNENTATMQRFVVTLWHGALLLVMVMGLVIALIGAVERFVTGWGYAPGILPLLVVVAIEAMLTHWMIVRDRQQAEEQIKVRLMELLVMIIVVRLWSLAAQSAPLLATITPWLREPLLFLSGRFFEYLIWALITWVVTTLLMNDILDWQRGTYVGGDVDESSIERDLLQQEWDESVARYRRRYLALVFAMLTASTLAVYGGEPLTAINGTLLVSSTIAALVAGLVLQSAGRLSLLRRGWAIDNIAVDAGVSQRWGRMGLVLILMLVLLAPVVGAVMLVAPPPPIVPVLNVLLVAMTVIVSIVLLLISILLSPLIYLLSLLSSTDTSPPPPSMPQIEPPQIAQVAGERPLWPALIFWGCIAVLVVFAFVRYIRSRSGIGDAIRRWRIVQWLRATAQELWSDARGWTSLAVASLRRLRPSTSAYERARTCRGRSGAVTRDVPSDAQRGRTARRPGAHVADAL